MPTYHLDTKRLTECREKIGLTKNEAAKKIGVSQPAYLRYESGERTPSIQVVNEMAQVFHTSADYLLGVTSNSNVDTYVVRKDDNPALFDLVSKCINAEESQLSRLNAYWNRLTHQIKL